MASPSNSSRPDTSWAPPESLSRPVRPGGRHRRCVRPGAGLGPRAGRARLGPGRRPSRHRVDILPPRRQDRAIRRSNGSSPTVAETVKTGRVLVPAFALGRAQEVVLTLRDRLPDVPILVDGMAKEISRIYEAQTEGTSRPLQIYGEQREGGPARVPARAVYRDAPWRHCHHVWDAVGGPAVQWARWILPDPTSALLVSGYQDEESPGRALLDLAKGEGLTFSLDGQDIEVKANVAEFKLSAHAGRSGLTSIVRDVAPAQTMLVHGVASAQFEFADHLRRNGHRTVRTERWQSSRRRSVAPDTARGGLQRGRRGSAGRVAGSTKVLPAGSATTAW